MRRDAAALLGITCDNAFQILNSKFSIALCAASG
jgi:hypothetical protein